MEDLIILNKRVEYLDKLLRLRELLDETNYELMKGNYNNIEELIQKMERIDLF